MEKSTYIQRLTEDIVHQVERQMKKDGNERRVGLQAAFDSLRYRANYIDETELRIAYILGKAIAFFDLDIKDVKIIVKPGACSVCRTKDGKIIPSDTLGILELPPFHPNCRCDIEEV